jgi:hypothetical protein
MNRAVVTLLRILALALILAPVFYWRGGILEMEGTIFIQNYLGERTALQKVFNPIINDFDNYQGRELSHFIDYLDAHAFRFLLGLGFPLFIGASLLMASAATLVIHQVGTARMQPELDRVSSTLVLLLFFSNFVHLSTIGIYYRSAKPMLVPLVLLGLLLIWHFQREPGSHRRSAFAAIFGLGLAIALLDRIGFFFVMTAAAILSLRWLVRRDRLDVVAGVLASWVASMGYNRLLGPALIHAINGYWPNLSFQDMRPARIFTEPSYLLKGAILTGEQAWLLGGSPTGWVLAAVGLAALGLVLFGGRQRLSFGLLKRLLARPCLWLAVLVLLALVILNAMLVLRHAPLYDFRDHRLWYYALPTQIVFTFGLLQLLRGLLPRCSRRGVLAVQGLLLAMVVSNIARWEHYKLQMLSSQWFPEAYGQSGLLKQSLAQRAAQPDLAEPFRSFFDYCLPLMPQLPQTATSHGPMTGYAADLSEFETRKRCK